MPNGQGGYSFDPTALGSMTAKFREGSAAIDDAADGGIQAPDAGASSGAVGRAIHVLLTSAAGGASRLDDVAGQIHQANGAYGEMENTAEAAAKKLEEEEKSKGYGERNIPLN